MKGNGGIMVIYVEVIDLSNCIYVDKQAEDESS